MPPRSSWIPLFILEMLLSLTFIPSIEASATKYNYHFYEDLYFEDYDFVKIEKAITDNADLPSVSLRFDTEDAMEEAIGELIDSNKFREILSSLDKTSYSYIVSRDQFVIVFMPE